MALVDGEDRVGFLRLVDEVGASRTILVGIDVGKFAALALIADGRGELLAEPLDFALDEPGVSDRLGRPGRRPLGGGQNEGNSSVLNV